MASSGSEEDADIPGAYGVATVGVADARIENIELAEWRRAELERARQEAATASAEVGAAHTVLAVATGAEAAASRALAEWKEVCRSGVFGPDLRFAEILDSGFKSRLVAMETLDMSGLIEPMSA